MNVENVPKEDTVQLTLPIAAQNVQVDKLPMEKEVQPNQLVILQVRRTYLQYFILAKIFKH